jgi:beta-galactosidase GanA
MGLNAVQFYVPWNWHSPVPNEYDFSSPGRNITAFFDICQRNDILVLLRLGPYVCGEWDFGGFPWWLLTVPDIEIRTNNSQYLR